MRLRYIILVCSLSPLFVWAGVDDALQRYEEFAKSAQAKYDATKSSAEKKYSAFRAEAMGKYAAFLKDAWTQYSASPRVEIPKEEPVPPVIYEEEEQKKEDEEIIYDEVILTPEPTPAPTPDVEPVIPIEDLKSDEAYSKLSIEFYGTPVTIRVPEKAGFSVAGSDGTSVSSVWEKLSTGGYDATVQDCLEAKNSLNLCDWAYLLLVRQVAEKRFWKSDEATMLAAYIYAVSGYKMRLARSGSGKLYMLFGSNYKICDANYYDINGTCFYPIDCQESSLHISSASFDGEKPLSLAITGEQHFTPDYSVKRNLSSNEISTGAVVNQNLIAFYNDMPTAALGSDMGSRWALYANAPMSKVTKESLYPSLRSAITGKDTYTALNMLLNFVQTAFSYEYDEKVWGGDRAFFSEETLYYPYADCEDRSILFSRLVKDLMGLDVVLLYYPGHIATAVNINCNGDYLNIDGKKYVICDPTYIGASVGCAMPKLKGASVNVIKLN